MRCLYCFPLHCVKSARIRSYPGPYFPAFRMNTERYGASIRSQYECEKIRTRITPNTNTFHAVLSFLHQDLSILRFGLTVASNIAMFGDTEECRPNRRIFLSPVFISVNVRVIAKTLHSFSNKGDAIVIMLINKLSVSRKDRKKSNMLWKNIITITVTFNLKSSFKLLLNLLSACNCSWNIP